MQAMAEMLTLLGVKVALVVLTLRWQYVVTMRIKV